MPQLLFILSLFIISVLNAEDNCIDEFDQLKKTASTIIDSGYGDLKSGLIAAIALQDEGLCEDACTILREALSLELLNDSDIGQSDDIVAPKRWYNIDVSAGFNWFKYDESDSAAYYYQDTLLSDTALSSYAGEPSYEVYGSGSITFSPNIEWIKRIETGFRVGNISYQHYSRLSGGFLDSRIGFDLYEKGNIYRNRSSGDSSDLLNASGDLYAKYPFTLFGSEIIPKAAAIFEIERYRYDRSGYISSKRLIFKPGLMISHGNFWANYSIEHDSKKHSIIYDSLNTQIWRNIFSADYYSNKFNLGLYGNVESDNYVTGEAYCTIPLGPRISLELRLNYENEKTNMTDSYILSNDVLYLPGFDTLFLDSSALQYDYALYGQKSTFSVTGKWELSNQCYTGLAFTGGRAKYPEITAIDQYSLNDTISPLEDPYTFIRLGTLFEYSRDKISIDVDIYGENKKPSIENPSEAKSVAYRGALTLSWNPFKEYAIFISCDFEKRWYDTLNPKDQYSEKIAAHTITNTYLSMEIRGKF
jgi:hypothetical protein